MQNLKKNLISSILMTVITLITTLGTVYAWFTLKNHSDLDGFEVSVESRHLINPSINTYAISGFTETELQKNYMLAVSSEQLVSLQSIPMYDEKGIAMNQYKSYLAVNLTFSVTVDNVNGKIVAHAVSDFVTTVNNSISNCIQIVPVNYNSATLSLSSYDVPKSFVTIENNVATKTKTMEISNNIYPAGNVSLWFVLEYNVPALNLIHSQNTTSNIELINYSNDIKLEIIEL